MKQNNNLTHRTSITHNKVRILSTACLFMRKLPALSNSWLHKQLQRPLAPKELFSFLMMGKNKLNAGNNGNQYKHFSNSDVIYINKVFGFWEIRQKADSLVFYSHVTIRVSIDIGSNELQCLFQQLGQRNRSDFQHIFVIRAGPEDERRSDLVVHHGGVPGVLLVVLLHRDPTWAFASTFPLRQAEYECSNKKKGWIWLRVSSGREYYVFVFLL